MIQTCNFCENKALYSVSDSVEMLVCCPSHIEQAKEKILNTVGFVEVRELNKAACLLNMIEVASHEMVKWSLQIERDREEIIQEAVTDGLIKRIECKRDGEAYFIYTSNRIEIAK